MQKFICHVSVTCSVQRRGRPMHCLFLNDKSKELGVRLYLLNTDLTDGRSNSTFQSPELLSRC